MNIRNVHLNKTLILPSNPKRKIRVNTSSLDRNEKDGDIHSANTTKENRLSDTDKEILKVLLSPDDGIKYSSLMLTKKLGIPLTTHSKEKETVRERIFDILIHSECRKIWLATRRLVNLYTKWKDRFCSKQITGK